jgi:TolB-like protein
VATALAVAGSPSARHLVSDVVPRQLDSWKEIAAFFARTVRTVQRWESTEDLPVYHHIHVKCSSVYALEPELIAWRDARSRQQDESHPGKKSSNCRLRLAVLPFANLSDDPRLRHFEDGLTYEIIAQLARLDPARLGVIARTTVMPLKKSRSTVAQIGRCLNVDYVLEGSVRLAARKMRIAAQLIDVSDQTQLFADACALRWTDEVFIQVAIAERIARMVSGHLLASGPPSICCPLKNTKRGSVRPRLRLGCRSVIPR